MRLLSYDVSASGTAAAAAAAALHDDEETFFVCTLRAPVPRCRVVERD